MADNAYATVDELKDFLCLADNDRDYALDNIVTTASRLIDRWTGHQFYSVSAQVRYFEWLPGSDVNFLKVDDLLSLTELATDSNGDGVYETVWTTGTDYYLWPVNAVAKNEPFTRIYRSTFNGRFYFPAYPRGVRITGTWGYATATPAPIKQLCLIVSQCIAGPLLDMSIPGVSSYKLGSDIYVTMTPAVLPQEARWLLSLYGDQTFVVI